MRRVAVLGSTGSIGTSCLDVIAALPGRLAAVSLTAHTNWDRLCVQARQCRPRWVTLTDDTRLAQVDRSCLDGEVEMLDTPDRVERLVRDPDTDVVLTAIVGAAGLRGTWAALDAGKTVCVANKETLVLAGPLVMDLARRTGARILPVDSEHSAVFQAMQAGRTREVRRVQLTASGGPFRTWSRDRLEAATPEQALRHPTWQMGRKITIDSATMMNKALEIIEAKWLFGLDPDQIEVVVHPESIVHSLVEFVDGSVIAQLSPPDMRLPIQYALCYPERLPGPAPHLDLAQAGSLHFEAADPERFPALRLGYEVARQGGTAGAVLNAANEVAVDRFLTGELRFTDIVRACRTVLESHTFDPSPTLDDLLAADRWARVEARSWR
ncbi:MAG: 1-deoxy-D-xylulose-5-phosphate reductoisomerase [Planctomycetes bacterium]|nr:1-deoxy-D-xylulose-5-phosphate reductoisomerase [Planctomycetota bacterium]